MSDTESSTRIVYCRELDPDTVLHLTRMGDDYLLRRFDGTAPFDAHDQPRYSELRACYRLPLDRALDAEEAAHPVEDEQWWSERIAQVNAELLPELKKA